MEIQFNLQIVIIGICLILTGYVLGWFVRTESKIEKKIQERYEDLTLDINLYDIDKKNTHIKTINMVFVPCADQRIVLGDNYHHGVIFIIRRVEIKEFGSVINAYGEIVNKHG